MDKLRHRCDAMVGRQHDRAILQADVPVEKLKELSERAIHLYDVVHDLMAVRTVKMADRIIRRKAQAKHIRNIRTPSQLLVGDHRFGEVFDDLVVKRRVVECAVEARPGSGHAARHGFRQGRAEFACFDILAGHFIGALRRIGFDRQNPIPHATEVRVELTCRIPSFRPVGKLRHVVSGTHHSA
jgi:hypothetical protein